MKNKVVGKLEIFTLIILFIVFIWTVLYLLEVSKESQENGVAIVIITGTYEIEFEEGETALELIMENFNTELQTYSFLGVFIICIEDICQTGTQYVIIYVDGEKSSVGISQIVLYDGIEIEFRLE